MDGEFVENTAHMPSEATQSWKNDSRNLMFQLCMQGHFWMCLLVSANIKDMHIVMLNIFW